MNDSEEGLFLTTKRHGARILAVQFLYQLDQGLEQADLDHKELLNLAKTNIKDFGLKNTPDCVFLDSLLENFKGNYCVFDEKIKLFLNDNWTFDRIIAISKAILRCAYSEIHSKLDTPVPVLINEYVEIAKKFLDQKDVSFINATIDSFYKQKTS